MSEGNVERVRAGYEAFNRRDFDAALALGHDSIAWRPLFSLEADVLRGRQEVRAGRWSGRGSSSGAPVEQTAAQLITVEGGQIRSVETYETRDEALQAAALTE